MILRVGKYVSLIDGLCCKCTLAVFLYSGFLACFTLFRLHRLVKQKMVTVQLCAACSVTLDRKRFGPAHALNHVSVCNSAPCFMQPIFYKRLFDVVPLLCASCIIPAAVNAPCARVKTKACAREDYESSSALCSLTGSLILACCSWV